MIHISVIYLFIYLLYIISSRAVVGEVDEDLDKQIDLSIIRAEPLQQITH